MKYIEVNLYLEDQPEPGQRYLTKEQIGSAIGLAQKVIEKQYTGLIVSSFNFRTVKETNK